MIATADRRLPPGPRRPPLLQSLAWVHRPVDLLLDCRRRFGSRFTLRFLGGRNYVFLSSPEDVKALFASPPDVFRAGRANAHFRPFLGDGSLITVDGDEHRQHRKLLAPLLRGDALSAVDPITEKIARGRVARFRAGDTFDAIDEARAITLDIILATILGVRDEARTRRLRELVDELTRAASWLIVLQAPRVNFGPVRPWARYDAARSEFQAIMREEIDRVRKDGEGRNDMLACIVKEADNAPSRPSDQHLQDELLTLLSAGHETTTAAVAWATHFVLLDPDARARASEEARSVGSHDGAKTPYLEGCVAEALRLRPVIPIVPRFVAEDTTLSDLPLPRGTYVAAAAVVTHHDPALYPHPHRFDPLRFVDRKKPPPYVFFPFGGGARLCIGNLFAVREATLVLRELFARLDLELVNPGPQPIRRHGLSLVPADGARVVVRRVVASSHSAPS